jgi:uncharacterized DUF497 family protein
VGPKKAEANLSKHDVSFAEAVTAFGDPLSMNMPDPDHSEGEQRFIVLGMSDRYEMVSKSLLMTFIEPQFTSVKSKDAPPITVATSPMSPRLDCF